MFTKISFALAPTASSVLALSINSRSVTSTETSPGPTHFPTPSQLVDHQSELPRPYPSVNNVLAVANIIPANDKSPSPPARACVRPSFLSSSPPCPHSPFHSSLPLPAYLICEIHVKLTPWHPTQGWLHYILTVVNITNIRRLRYQLRLIHRCRAELRLCVCDRYGGEWNRDRRGRECDGYGRTCEWDGGLERGVGVCHVPHC
ncbi:hypothetical protein B0H11DRAFT_541718 [Mycena galericulata]|nr:hypothetical protein B0H11DRAFT_541718 [Mycena galericulata]